MELQKIKGRKLTKTERHERTEYWDSLAEADLRLLKEHIENNLHSTTFVSGALGVVQWLEISTNEDIKAYNSLREAMGQTSESRLRQGIYGALFLFKNHYPDTFEDFAHDSDLNISQRSLYWLVMNGEASYLPDYVAQSWRLFNSNTSLSRSNIASERNLQSLLAELIPDSGPLFSEQSQLQWLEKNLAALKWDGDRKLYRIPVETEIQQNKKGN